MTSDITSVMMVVAATLVGLACCERDQNDHLRFSWFSVIWGFLLIQAVGLWAGHALGTRTVQLSAGRDPEYETIDVRAVSDEERWRCAVQLSNDSIRYVVLGLLIAWLIAYALKRRKETYSCDRLGKLRSGVGVLALLVFVLLMRSLDK